MAMTTRITGHLRGRRSTEGAAAAAPSRAARQRRAHQQRVAWAFLAPVTVYLLVFYAFPMYRNVDLSLRDYTLRSFIDGSAKFSGFDNYEAIFSSPTFWPAAWHTATFTLLSIFFQFWIGMALAVFFFKKFPLSSLLRALFLVPWLLPLLVSASVWAWMFNSDSGVLNSALELMGFDAINWLTSPEWAMRSVLITNIWIGIPFNLVLLYSGLQNIPDEVYEAASLDGAGPWQTFWRITFPLLRPVSAITLLLGFVYTLKVLDIIWVMTRGGPGDSSTTLATWSYRLGFGGQAPELSEAAAVSNVLVVVALIAGLGYIRAQRKEMGS